MFDEHTREVDYTDKSVTENTRAAYPIEYIPNSKIPCVGPHPKNVILLACDAFGVLPPISKLNLAQTMYHFISGYTALVSSGLFWFGLVRFSCNQTRNELCDLICRLQEQRKELKSLERLSQLVLVLLSLCFTQPNTLLC